MELIAFQVGQQEFCVDIMQVREIRDWTPATPLPHAPPFVKGLLPLEDRMVSMIALDHILPYSQEEPAQAA